MTNISQPKVSPQQKVPRQQIDCLGVVLAGGLSSRMGEDKAQLQHKNTNMLNFSKQLLKDAGISQVVISGNKHQIPDLMTNLGPVGGIYSVIKHYQPRAVLILPVDLPLMTALALKKLKLTGELSQKACFYQDNHIPLYLPNSVYLDLFFQQAFNQQENQETLKGPSVRALLNQIPNQSIISDDPALLFNTNTPQQWQQAKSIFK